MIDLKFTVSEFGKITRTDLTPVISDSIGWYSATFTFHASWSESKTALFKNGDVEAEAVLINNTCVIPSTVLAERGDIRVSVYCGDRKTANVSKVQLTPSGYFDSTPPPPPEPTQVAMYTFSDASGVRMFRYLDSKLEWYNGTVWTEVSGGTETACNYLPNDTDLNDIISTTYEYGIYVIKSATGTATKHYPKTDGSYDNKTVIIRLMYENGVDTQTITNSTGYSFQNYARVNIGSWNPWGLQGITNENITGMEVNATTGNLELSAGYVIPTTAALANKLEKNPTITGLTKTKITFDTNGLVTGGADATTADIADTTNKRYVTDAQKTKLDGVADNANNYTHPANHPPSIITQDVNNRFVTDTEKSTWNGKENAGVAIPKTTNITSIDENGLAAGQRKIIEADFDGQTLRASTVGVGDLATAANMAKRGGLIATYEVTGATETEINFTGLDILADGGVYQVIISSGGGTSGAARSYNMWADDGAGNINTTASDYIVGGTSGGTGSFLVAGAFVVFSADIKIFMMNASIPVHAMAQMSSVNVGSSSMSWARYHFKPATKPTNLTKLMFNELAGNYFPVGFTISIYKMGVL